MKDEERQFLDEVKARVEKRYPMSIRTHRAYHEKRAQWPEETAECYECDDEYNEESSARLNAALADIPRLIQMVEERDAEIERLSTQIVRVIHDNELIIEMGEVDEAKIQALQAEVESLRSELRLGVHSVINDVGPQHLS